MSEQVRPKFTFRDFLGYLLAYWFWILGAAISMLALFMIRQMINVMWPAIQAADRVGDASDRSLCARLFGPGLAGLFDLYRAVFPLGDHRCSEETAQGPRRPKPQPAPRTQDAS